MLKERTFNLVIVSENYGNGLEITKQFNKTINYNGKKIEINL